MDGSTGVRTHTWRHGISLATNDESDAGEVRRLLQELEASEVGRVLLQAIGQQGRNLLIIVDAPDGACSAVTYPMQRERQTYDQAVAGSYLRGAPLTEGRGTGRGSAAMIYFSPHAFGSCGPMASPAEALFHELVHGYRITRGVRITQSTGDFGVQGFEYLHDGIRFYAKVEEFYAVTLTNIYRSERTPGQPARPLRATYPRAETLDASASQWLSMGGNRAALEAFVAGDRPFASQLARLKRPTFNPFAQMGLRSSWSPGGHFIDW